MKVLNVYILGYDLLDEDFLEKLKKQTKTDLAICMRACNQLEGIQYPYITIDEL